jgi:plasmid stabilization system protein ParE
LTPVRFRAEAIREMLEARDWYESHAVGLGASFVLAVEAAVARIRRAPSMFPKVDDVFRQALLRRFPYSLVFHATDDEIAVVSCFHHRRRPGSWRVQDGD